MDGTPDSQIRKVLHHYIPLSKGVEEEIWEKQSNAVHPGISDVPDDERVEDAGLTEDVPIRLNSSRPRRKQPELVFA